MYNSVNFCNQSKETIDWSVMGPLMAGLFHSFALVFVFTECGEHLKSRLDEHNDAITECVWYTFPLKVQRMMPTIFLAVQNPMAISAYGGVPCERTTFKAVSFNPF